MCYRTLRFIKTTEKRVFNGNRGTRESFDHCEKQAELTKSDLPKQGKMPGRPMGYWFIASSSAQTGQILPRQLFRF